MDPDFSLTVVGTTPFYLYTFSIHMTALNLISIDTRGFNIPHKRTTVLEFLRKTDIDFAMIQESHLLCKDVGRLANKFYHPIATSSTRDQHLASEALHHWASETGMVDIWRLLNPFLKDFTFYSGRHKPFSRLDFIFASKDLFQNIQNAHYILAT
uniref:Endonuclease/exonuclease/phosphatase domain-containing protein n=1 Tax=Cyprinus carpio TaxID=7962 RepID=A0A8C1MQU0_CYPCA